MNFENLDEYYNYIENDFSLLFDYNISYALIKLRDKTEDKELKSYCSYESYFADYTINCGEINPKISYPNGESYPNFALFDYDLEYIKSRAENVKNPKYKAKYCQLLWESKLKHYDYAKMSIDNYFLLLTNNSIPIDDNLSQHTFENYIKNLFILAQNINYKKEETIQFFISLLGSKIINGYKEYSLMKFISEEGKKINKTVLKTFFDYSNKVNENAIYPDFNKQYLQLLIILCQKLNLTPKNYHNKLGEFYVLQSKNKKEESFVIHDFYLNALGHFKNAGNKERIEDVAVLIEKAKRKLNFNKIETEFTDDRIKKLWDELNRITDNLTEKYSSRDIYEYIMLAPNVFPKAEVLKEDIRPVMFDLISVMNFDINKNVSGKQKSGINTYYIHIQSFSINHLWMIFSKGIKNGKISFETLIDFLKNHTWYGQDFSFTNAQNEIEGFNWIELLSPSLMSFFIQSEIDIKTNKNSSQGYILAIDSLVIKFEGLLREFSRNIGAQVIEYKEDGTEARISFDKLLENEKLKELIPEDDIALFKFLFTSDGMNLRNNIAHCFYQTKNYSPATMFLLISALLKLGNYKLNIQ